MLLLASGCKHSSGHTNTHTHTHTAAQLTHVVYEALDLGLHAPVSELHFAELVGTHDGALWILVDLLDPVVRQRTPFGLDGLIELRIFLRQVLMRSDVILHDVDGAQSYNESHKHKTDGDLRNKTDVTRS